MLFVNRFYFIAAVLGTLVPWAFFADYFYSNGFAPMAFLGALFVNGAAGGFSADTLISILVFWVWATRNARRHGVKYYWFIYPVGCFVGLSIALPLYLYLREVHMDTSPIPANP